MAEFPDLLRQALDLPEPQRRRLARELAFAPAKAAGLTAFGSLGAAPHSVAWLKSERGHAVLALDADSANASVTGYRALAGIWSDRLTEEPGAAE